jgi:hypothetical protein
VTGFEPATILLILAIALTVVFVVLVAVLVLLRRKLNNPADAVELARQAAALRTDVTAPKVVEHHHYVHTLPGATAGEASWAPLVKGTAEFTED